MLGSQASQFEFSEATQDGFDDPSDSDEPGDSQALISECEYTSVICLPRIHMPCVVIVITTMRFFAFAEPDWQLYVLEISMPSNHVDRS